MSTHSARPTILYDADCGFCRWSLAQILALDRHERLRIAPLDGPEAAAALPGLTSAQRATAARLVMPDGTVHSGGAVVAPLAAVLGGGARVVAVLRALEPPMSLGYRAVAGNRTRLSKLVPARAKRRADAVVARRLARS